MRRTPRFVAGHRQPVASPHCADHRRKHSTTGSAVRRRRLDQVVCRTTRFVGNPLRGRRHDLRNRHRRACRAPRTTGGCAAVSSARPIWSQLDQYCRARLWVFRRSDIGARHGLAESTPPPGRVHRRPASRKAPSISRRGIVTSARDGCNVRVDIYDGAHGPPESSTPNPAAATVLKGEVGGIGANRCPPINWTVGQPPLPRPPACRSTRAIPYLEGRMGRNGVWDFDTYEGQTRPTAARRRAFNGAPAATFSQTAEPLWRVYKLRVRARVRGRPLPRRRNRVHPPAMRAANMPETPDRRISKPRSSIARARPPAAAQRRCRCGPSASSSSPLPLGRAADRPLRRAGLGLMRSGDAAIRNGPALPVRRCKKRKRPWRSRARSGAVCRDQDGSALVRRAAVVFAVAAGRPSALRVLVVFL